MHVAAVRAIQRRLKELGHYAGRVDGDRGPQTDRAVDLALAERSRDVPDAWPGWSRQRRAVAFLQLMCIDAGFDAGEIDGLWGPQTEFAFESFEILRKTGEPPVPWRDDEPLDVNPNNWPPENQGALEAFYGPHGMPGRATPPPPMLRVACPWTLRLAWDTSQIVRSISIHERVARSLERILGRVHAHYGEDRLQDLRLDLYGGSYAPRRKRHGTSWSTHAWAIAIDWDPSNNKLEWGRDRASLARPEYADWWRFWEEEGWVSLGRARNFDWMHVQAARL
jgi:hypothetical protein